MGIENRESRVGYLPKHILAYEASALTYAKYILRIIPMGTPVDQIILKIFLWQSV